MLVVGSALYLTMSFILCCSWVICDRGFSGGPLCLAISVRVIQGAFVFCLSGCI